MKIEVIPYAAAIHAESIENKTVVVIDVLRATSVMITALQNGAKEIIPCASIKEAKQKATEIPPGSYLLCGERDAKKIDGFDLGNSPLEFTRKTVENKTLIITTTNGTKALNVCRAAKTIYIGGFLNVDAITEKTKELDELVLVCSGTRDKFSLDDGICAAAIIEGLTKHKINSLDDLGQSMLMIYKNNHSNLNKILKDCIHLNYLKKAGYEEDINYCLMKNTTSLTPVFNPKSHLIGIP